MLASVFMLALRSVQRNMLRSFLTILGIGHRRERGDHDGDAGQRRHAGDPGADLGPGHQPADGAPGPARLRRAEGAAVVAQFTEADAARRGLADRRRGRGGAARRQQRHRGGQRPQLGHHRHRQQQRLVHHRQLGAGQRAPLRRRRAAVRRRGVHPGRGRCGARSSAAPWARPGWAESLRVKQFSCGRGRHPRGQGPGRHGRPGRRGGGAAAHAAAPRHRQPQGQHAAGVDGRRQRRHAPEGQPARAAARTAQAGRRRRRQLQHLRHTSSWRRRCPAPPRC